MPYPSARPDRADDLNPTPRAANPPGAPRRRAARAIAAGAAFAVVGSLLSATPAMAAGLEPGDDGAYRFDFGTATSPVAEGAVQVTEATRYAAETGFGPVPADGAGLISRWRQTDGATVPIDAMNNDFVAGAAWEFLADVPDGEYDVTVLSGDELAGTSSTATSVQLEGVDAGRITSRQAVASQTFRTVVADGQLTVGLAGAGVGAYVNGIVVQPVVPEAPATPADVAVTRIAYDGVDLAWTAVDAASAYRVYRADVTLDEQGQPVIGDATQLAEVTDAAYADASVEVGGSYAYSVSAVGADGLESPRSEPPALSGEIPPLQPPAAPADVAVAQVARDGVTLTWSAVPNAAEYVVERTDAADGAFTELAVVTEPGYLDAGVDTERPWFYRVTARNEAGASEASVVIESPAYDAPDPLPAGDSVTFDFGPGAVADGALPVTSGTAFDAEWGYGFSVAPSAAPADVDRGGDDALRGDFVLAQGGTFEVDLGAGDYSVALVAGDSEAASSIAVTAESMAKVQLAPKAAGEYLAMSFPIALVDGRLTLQVTGDAAALNSLTITRQAPRLAGAEPTVYLAGDSTVQTYDPIAWAPQAGWGQMIDRFLGDGVNVANHAIGGRSSKNFISQGRLDEILRSVRPGDYLFVQFGHNDATQGVDDRYASPADYKEYLRVYVDGVRQRGGTPVLVTPVSRRSFDATTGLFNVSFPEYVAKMTELAAEEGVLLVDLSASSRAYLDEIGPEAAKAVFLHVDPGIFPNRPAGIADDTHFQEYGAIQMARLVAQDVRGLDDPLAASVIDVEPPAEVPPAPANLVAGAISNAGAVLQWDAAPTADIYKIFRQLVGDPENTWSLVGTTTQTSSVVQGLIEGATYRYYVVAVNGRGDSAASGTVTFTTKQARWKFDFGPATQQVMPGYKAVNPGTGHTVERGFGFASTAGLGDRDRGSMDGVPNDLQRDFVLPGDSAEFLLDVPNGTYSVKTYSGDWIGSTRTNFDLEGRSFGSGNAGRASVNESVRGPVLVTDGQLTVRIHGAAAGTRINGLEVTPILLGPTGLEVTDVAADPDAPSVSLAWDHEDDLTWKVYRQSEHESEPQFIGSVDEPSFTDVTGRIGLDYRYHVTAVDQTGLESVPSGTAEISLVDPDVDAPGAPAGVTLESIEDRSLELSWSQPVDALYYLVFRSEVAGEDGELVGLTEAPRFTDADVLTTVPYFYRVVAVNAGGSSAASDEFATPTPTVLQRQAEYLDRAPTAVGVDGGVLVSWRMLGTDPDAIAFHVYRDGARITDEPITDSTNLLDADGTGESTYFVTAVLDDREVTETGEFGVRDVSYLSVPLDKPADAYTKDGQPYSYSANDTSVGDVDGDGQYELFVKWYPSNAKDNSQAGYTGNVLLDAYRMDGTRLWRMDLGPNVRAGAHYTHFMVYDLDGDGRAEVTLKTADGTIDGVGQPIGNAAADHRNSSGYVLQGPEFLTVFDGETGAAIDTIDYVPARGDVGSWGDSYGNRVDRFLAGVAYLDGETPSVLFSRGYYTRAVVAAYDFDGQQLVERWVIDSDQPGSEGLYGQGNHSLAVADVDGDQKDEVLYGSATIDDDGELLYSTGLGHGDAQHVGDLDPARAGLEVFSAHEDMSSSGNRGATMRDARTGEILWDIPADRDTGRAASGDIDPRHAGAEGWAIGGDAAWNSRTGQLRSATGELVANEIPAANFLAWFDGDPLREIVDHSWDADTSQGVPTVSKWNWETSSEDVILTDDGARSNNGTKGTPNLQADLFGDWREEIAWRSADSTELRIYATTEETELRIRTLMHDTQYRTAVAWQNTGYNQPPHPSFFIGNGMAEPPAPQIAVTAAPGGPTDATAPVVTGVPADGALLPDSGAFTVEVAATDPESGVRNLDLAFDGEPVAPGQVIPLDGLAGTHTLTVRAANHAGLVTASSVSLLVYEDEGATEAPGRGSLSSNSGWEDGLHDGAFTISMNLWHGVNGSVFRLYEDGELVSTQLLSPDSPSSQLATFDVAGKENGDYVYTGELVNAAGTTATTSVTVKVRDAAPAQPVLTHDNRDRDGNYVVTANLWWGTNATSYRLYEDGVLIDEQPLVAASPGAQSVSTAIAGRAPGEYVYLAEFANAAGVTESKPITVRVK